MPNKIKERLIRSLKDGKLDLSECEISDDILIKIIPFLSLLNITHLNLFDNEIGDVGARALAKELETNATLTDLNLVGNNIGDKGTIATVIACLTLR